MSTKTTTIESATPEIVALADRVVSGIAAYSARAAGLRNFIDHPECKRIFADYCEAWDALAALPSRNPADIVEKLRAAEPYFSGSDTGELCEMLWADCRRLAAAKVIA